MTTAKVSNSTISSISSSESSAFVRSFRGESAEAGFTLIELLVVMAVIGILSGLALQSFYIYRYNAYHGVALATFGQARTALEAGKADTEDFNAPLAVDQTTAGPATQGDGRDLVPGLVLPPHFHIYASHDPTCTSGACMVDYVAARHCLVHKKAVYFRVNGLPGVTMLNVTEPGDC